MTLRKKYIDSGLLDQSMLATNTKALVYQVPGGMLSNLLSQLKQAGKADKLEEVLQRFRGFVRTPGTRHWLRQRLRLWAPRLCLTLSMANATRCAQMNLRGWFPVNMVRRLCRSIRSLPKKSMAARRLLPAVLPIYWSLSWNPLKRNVPSGLSKRRTFSPMHNSPRWRLTSLKSAEMQNMALTANMATPKSRFIRSDGAVLEALK